MGTSLLFGILLIVQKMLILKKDTNHDRNFQSTPILPGCFEELLSKEQYYKIFNKLSKYSHFNQ